MAAGESDNGHPSQRVTNAKLALKLGNLETKLDDGFARLEGCYQEERGGRMKLEERVRANKEDIIRLDERVTSSSRILAGLQVIGSSIAAAIGVTVKN